MATIKCSKGHLYDSAQGSCPVCAREGSSWNFGGVPDDIPATSPAGNWGGFAEVSETMPGAGFGINIGETEPVTSPGFTAGDFYVKPGGSAPKLDDYEPTGVVPMEGEAYGFDPVVGWLICVKGPNRGRDYRLHSGTNFIGSSKEMDVCIEHDQTISHRNAASISYDDRSKTFYIQKGDVRNLLYLNGRSVRSDADIVIYDRIEIGSTELIFIPLCGDGFSWQGV